MNYRDFKTPCAQSSRNSMHSQTSTKVVNAYQEYVANR